MWVRSLGWEDALEESMATHSSLLAWRIPWIEELVGYSSWGCRVRHNWNRLAHTQVLVQSLSCVRPLSHLGLQHSRLSCPSLSPRVCSDSHTSSRWCHPTISSSVIPFSSCPQSFPASVFSNESALPIRWTKYWPFSCFIARERKSMPGFKASKDRLTLLLGANVCGDLKLKPMFIYYLNILGPLIMMPNPLCLCSVNGTTNPRWQHIFWQHSLLNILSPLLRTPAQKKKKHLFQNMTACW